MNPKDEAIQQLNNQSLFEKVAGQLLLVQHDSQRCDQELLDLEAECEAKKQTLEQFLENVDAVKEELSELEIKLHAKKDEYDAIENRQLMLADLGGLLKGVLFRGASQGAQFFTHDVEGFAHFYDVGPLTVEAAIRESTDGFSCLFQGKPFTFIRGSDGSYYLHPVSIDVAVLLKS